MLFCISVIIYLCCFSHLKQLFVPNYMFIPFHPKKKKKDKMGTTEHPQQARSSMSICHVKHSHLGILVPGGRSPGKVGLVWLDEAHLHVRCCAQDVC